jgi:hypothetical protein
VPGFGIAQVCSIANLLNDLNINRSGTLLIYQFIHIGMSRSSQSFHLPGTESATLCESERHTHIRPRTKASSAEPKACNAVSGMRPEATLEPSVRILTNRAHSISLPNFSTMSHSSKSEQ